MRTLLIVAALLAVAGCGKPDAPAPPAPAGAVPAPSTSGQTVPPGPDMPAASTRSTAPALTRKPARSEPQAPELSLVVNGQQDEPVVVAGWPLVVRLEVRSPDGKPWRLAGGSERIVLKSSSAAPWALELTSQPAGEFTVDASSAAAFVWTMKPEATLALARGPCSIEAVLDCSKETAADAWKGVAVAAAPIVTIVDDLQKAPKEWAGRKAEVAIDYALWREGPDAALAQADRALTAEKDEWRLHWFKGHLLEKLERGPEAVRSLDEAIAVWRRRNPKACVPLELTDHRARLARQVIRDAVRK